MSALPAKVARLEEISRWPAERLAKRNDRISGWSVAEQADHTLKVLSSILDRIERGKDLDGTVPPATMLGRFVMLTGYIPRGRGKSPAQFHGTAAPAEALASAVATVKQQLAALDRQRLRHPGLVLLHPIFRGLNPAQSVRLAEIHTEHHLKIIREIDGSQ